MSSHNHPTGGNSHGGSSYSRQPEMDLLDRHQIFTEAPPPGPFSFPRQQYNTWVPPGAPGHGQPEGPREDTPPPVGGVEVQDPHRIDMAYQGTVDNHFQSLPNPPYMFPDAGHAQGIPIQVQPDAPVDQDHNPFGYGPPHDAPGLVQNVFPHPFVQRIPTPDPPPQTGTENLRRLASHYLHHPDAQVSIGTMESGTGGRIKVAVIFISETPDF